MEMLGTLRLAFQTLAGDLAVEGLGAGRHLLAEGEHGGRPLPFQEGVVVDRRTAWPKVARRAL